MKKTALHTRFVLNKEKEVAISVLRVVCNRPLAMPVHTSSITSSPGRVLGKRPLTLSSTSLSPPAARSPPSPLTHPCPITCRGLFKTFEQTTSAATSLLWTFSLEDTTERDFTRSDLHSMFIE